MISAARMHESRTVSIKANVPSGMHIQSLVQNGPHVNKLFNAIF